MAGELVQTPQQTSAPEPDDAEMARRMNGWMGISQQVQNDPSLRQALILFGAHMMQPTQPGDTALGQAGRALAAGSIGYGTMRGDIAEQQAQAEKDAANIEHMRAQTGQAKAETTAIGSREAREQQKLPGEIARTAALTRQTTALAQKEEEEFLVLKAKRDAGLTTPAELKRLYDLELKKLESENLLRGQQAAESGARAGLYGAEKKEKEQAFGLFEAFRNHYIDQLDEVGRRDPAQRREAEYKAWQDVLEHKRRAAGGTVSAGVQTAMYWRDTLKRMNPGATDQQIAAKEVELRNMGVIVRALVEKSNDVMDEAGAKEAATELQRLLKIGPETAKPAPGAPAAAPAPTPAATPVAPAMRFDAQGNRLDKNPQAPRRPGTGSTELPPSTMYGE